MRVFIVTDRGLHRDRLLGDLQHLTHFVFWHIKTLTQLFRGWLTPHLLQHLARYAVELVDRLDHMDRNTDSARLVSNRARDGLANPPRGIGGELIAAAIFKFINRLHQANIALLNEIKELQAAVGVLFRD